MVKIIKRIRDNRFMEWILLSLIIAAQIVNIAVLYANEKQNYFCDEIYSFGLSNSFYKPFLEADYVYEKNMRDVGEWIPGEEAHNYLTVQKGQQFRYDSVWYNQGQDVHPPLYYVVIHTICSFFPDTMSFLYGFIPNLVFFAVTQFFLYLSARKLLKSKYLAMLLCVFSGSTSVAINTTLFIRMYAMLGMWTVILLWLHTRLSVSDERPKLKSFVPFMLITAAGGLTQYQFLFIAFFMAVCYCVWFLINRRFRAMLMYGGSMLAGVLIILAAFPKIVQHFLQTPPGSIPRMFIQIPISVRYILWDNFGTIDLHTAWLLTFLPPFIGILAVMSLPVLFLFRDKLDLKTLPSRSGMKLKTVWHEKGKIIRKVFSINPLIIPMILSVCFMVMICSHSRDYLMAFADRYLYVVGNLVVLAFFIILCAIVRLFSGLFGKRRSGMIQKIILTPLVIAMTVNVIGKCNFTMWGTENEISLPELLNGSNVIITVDEPALSGIESRLTYEFINTDNFFLTTYKRLNKDIHKAEKLPSGSDLYFILYTEGFEIDEEGKVRFSVSELSESDAPDERLKNAEEYVKPYMNTLGMNNMEYKGTNINNYRNLIIYRLSR